jgi:hypothetical protein
MSLPLDPSYHAGDRSFQRNIDYRLATHVVKHGGQTIQDNGNILHEARDPDNPDHVIKVVTTPHPKKIVTVIRDTSRPFKDVQLAKQKDKEKKTEEVQSANRSKRNQKAQLAKKRLRNPPKEK